MSPEAPPTPPAPGGRAPSFGAPTGEKPSAFRIGGRFYGWQAIGIGPAPANPPIGYSGTALHVPMRSVGKIPFWGGAGATLNLSYGTKYMTAYTSYYFRVSSEEQMGFTNPQLGPSFGLAYLLITPDPMGTLRLNFRIGAFTEVYAGPGQWGWGIFGPMLAMRGYGETTNGEWDLTRDVRLTFTQGVLVVPGVPENFARGDYNSWIETGVSSFVHHSHLGAIVENQYTFRLHYASAHGTDERTVPADVLEHAADGRSLGHLSRRGALARRPLGTDRCQRRPLRLQERHGGRRRHLVGRRLDAGRPRDDQQVPRAAERRERQGRGDRRGVRLQRLAASCGRRRATRRAASPARRRTCASPSRGCSPAPSTATIPTYKGSTRYFFGLETEYRMTSMFSLTFQAYGEDRYSLLGRYQVYSLNPGIVVPHRLAQHRSHSTDLRPALLQPRRGPQLGPAVRSQHDRARRLHHLLNTEALDDANPNHPRSARRARAGDAAHGSAQAVDEGLPRLGLDPGEPQVRSATPALPFGVSRRTSKEYVLDFHGYFLLPARVGVHKRQRTRCPGQSELVLHSPPLMPQDLRSFEYTGVVPAPWLQLNFIYGNSTVSATAIIAGTSATDAAGFFNPVEQLGVNDAYLTLNLSKKVGYPAADQRRRLHRPLRRDGDLRCRRYGTPLIARTNTIGETITAASSSASSSSCSSRGWAARSGGPPSAWFRRAGTTSPIPTTGATFVSQAHVGIAMAAWPPGLSLRDRVDARTT